MSHREDPRERWRWEEDQRRRVERDLVEGEAFARDAGDPRWGTGGMADEGAYRAIRDEGGERAWSRSGRVPAVRPPSSHPGWESTRGPYVGIGPRGYRRSDERIREDVCERFSEHGQLDPSDVEVAVREGEVLLSGTVSTRAQKRLAEEIADYVFGVIEVHNHLRVQRVAAGAASSTSPPRGAPAPESSGERSPSAGLPSPDR
jgi:hypothetical protein